MLGALVLGLSSSQKAGMLIVAGAFIVFALVCSFLLPEKWPNFPGKSGLVPFIVISCAFFVGMMLTIIFVAKETKEEEEGQPESAAATIVQGVPPVLRPRASTPVPDGALHRYRVIRG